MGAFPLHIAARNGDMSSLLTQIGEGANLELKDESVRTGCGAAAVHVRVHCSAAAHPTCARLPPASLSL